MKWIKVEDALPRKKRSVLIFCKGYMEVSRLNEDGDWNYQNFHCCDPSHWMPLPDEPKKDYA